MQALKKVINISRDYRNVPPVPASIWRDPLQFIAFGFGVGAIPFAPGTFGTLVGVLLYLPLSTLLFWPYVITVTALTILATLICDKVSKQVGVDDHQGMCLDEVIGFLITMIGVPFSWQWIILGFLLFRVFDILKPWPIYLIDKKIHGGFGMMLDDIVAALFSCLILNLLSAW